MARRIWSALGSPRVALTLIALFTAACLFGNIVPAERYQTFGAPWFIMLAALLALSTLVCTIRQVRRAMTVPPALRLRYWGSALLHLGLVLGFATALASTVTGWQASLIMVEGGTFDPVAQFTAPGGSSFGPSGGMGMQGPVAGTLHGLKTGALASPPLPAQLPLLRLLTHTPRYSARGYDPDASSLLEVGTGRSTRRVRLVYGNPLGLNEVTLRQTRDYGAAVQLSVAPAPEGSSTQTTAPVNTTLLFVNQPHAEQQQRQLYMPGLPRPLVLHLLPGPLARDYKRRLDQRFILEVSDPVKTQLRVGEAVKIGHLVVRFTALRYWTVFNLVRAPLTPWFFAAGWLAVAGLGLGLGARALSFKGETFE